MKPYHKYVFDSKTRKFVGAFEEMYQQEDNEGFDSWQCSDLNHMPKKIHLAILNSYNFDSILDFGCGKGAFTHLLKKQNNHVTGVDISSTAIQKAKQYYGNMVDFHVLDEKKRSSFKQTKFDLTVILETLSYVENWKELIKDFAGFTKYIYISLYIPADPMGFVKSMADLITEIENYFIVEHKVIYNNDSIFLLAKNLNMEV